MSWKHFYLYPKPISLVNFREHVHSISQYTDDISTHHVASGKHHSTLLREWKEKKTNNILGLLWKYFGLWNPLSKKKRGGGKKKKSPLLMAEVIEVYKHEETFLRHPFAGKKFMSSSSPQTLKIPRPSSGLQALLTAWVLKMWSEDSWGVPDTFSQCPWSQSYFHNNINMLFAFSIMLTFALMVGKQWWIKPLAPYHELRPWHQTISCHCIHSCALAVKLFSSFT